MNQYITEDQWNTISYEEKEMFYRDIGWLEKKQKHLDSPVIGQMIDFLYRHETVCIESEERESPNYGWIVNKKHIAVELCDALWKEVCEVLIHIKKEKCL